MGIGAKIRQAGFPVRPANGAGSITFDSAESDLCISERITRAGASL